MHMSPATLLSSACLSALLVGGLHAQTAELSAVTCIGAESVFSSTSYPINSKASTNTIVASPLGSQATWSSPLPGDCPFKASELFCGIKLTGRHVQYGNADTWYPSWASDGNLYSPWTDGYMRDGAEGKEQIPFNMKHPSSACISANTTIIGRKPTMAATAQAKIVGDDPLNLKLFNLPPRVEASPAPEYEAKLHGVFQSCKLWKAKPNEYEGRYPCGSLVHNGVWYYGTYCLSNKPGDKGGWTLMGPFVGFRTSTDFGKTWTETPCTPRHPLFGENPYRKPIKIGSPHFVDFGRNMEHSPDGFAYLVAHGSMRPDAGNNWIQGDQVYLLRVKPSIQTLNDQSAYEYFAGHDADGKPVWTKTFEEIKPLLEWQDHLGCVTVTYNPGLKKFLLCVSRSIKLKASVLIMESDTLTGPWKVAASMKDFGPDAYFITIPSKFISPDGRTFWLCYSANYITHCTSGGNPPGSHYALCLQEATLLPVKH